MPINPTASICSTAEADLRVLICTQLVTHNFSQLVLSRCCAAVRCVSLSMRSLQLVEVQVIHIISSLLACFVKQLDDWNRIDAVSASIPGWDVRMVSCFSSRRLGRSLPKTTGKRSTWIMWTMTPSGWIDILRFCPLREAVGRTACYSAISSFVGLSLRVRDARV